MKLLLLNGHGINFKVDNARLHIKDGRTSAKDEPQEYTFLPKRIDVENIIVYGQNGNISITAIRWLIKQNVTITILNWNGKLLTVMLPPESVQVKTKFAQYHAYQNTHTKFLLAKKFITAKFEKTKLVLDWLKQRYPEIDNDISVEAKKLAVTQTIPDILTVEGRVASFYWGQLKKIFPNKYEFSTRSHINRPKGAGDHINCLLNYGYAILESQCLKAINSAGLDPHVGFMHQMAIGKNSLAYDLQEPYRFLIDLAVITCLENDAFTKKDFIRTENFNLRLRSSGAKKLLAEIEHQFNNKVEYKGSRTWHYILQIKTRELSHYLLKKRSTINFTQPKHSLTRLDSFDLREKILSIQYKDAEKLGFSKGAIHYMKKKALSSSPFKVYSKSMKKLLNVDNTPTSPFKGL